MPYNPCGRAVDWGRTGYARDCWFTRDHSTPPTRIIWYFTQLPFLEFDSAINQRIWDSDDIRHLELGEVEGSERSAPYRHIVTGLTGDHVCGDPAWFMEGTPVPYDGPDIEYNDQLIPLCCTRGPRGGVEFGGSAGDVYTPPNTVRGGVEFGGSAGDVYTPPDTVRGGVEFGGQTGDSYIIPTPTTGGVEFGGQTGDTYIIPTPTTGGVEFGGAAGDEYEGSAPGDTCATAGVLADSVPSPAVIAPNGVIWWVFTTFGFDAIHAATTVIAGSCDVFWWHGNCDGLVPIGGWEDSAYTNAGPIAATNWYLRITAGDDGCELLTEMGLGL